MAEAPTSQERATFNPETHLSFDDEDDDDEFAPPRRWDEGGRSDCGYSDSVHDTLMSIGGFLHGIFGEPSPETEQKMMGIGSCFQDASYTVRDFQRGEANVKEELRGTSEDEEEDEEEEHDDELDDEGGYLQTSNTFESNVDAPPVTAAVTSYDPIPSGGSYQQPYDEFQHDKTTNEIDAIPATIGSQPPPPPPPTSMPEKKKKSVVPTKMKKLFGKKKKNGQGTGVSD